MDAMVLSRLTTTPLRKPSDGLSPTPMMLTGPLGSSDSAMTTAPRLVPRSRPTALFRRAHALLERLLDRMGITGSLQRIYGLPGPSGIDLWGPFRTALRT